MTYREAKQPIIQWVQESIVFENICDELHGGPDLKQVLTCEVLKIVLARWKHMSDDERKKEFQSLIQGKFNEL